MITTLDDYPVHQTSQPIAIPATSDLNAYDRFWFNGFVGDGSLYFSIAMGFYPNRHVIDGGMSVVVDGHQHSLHLSGEAPLDRTKTELGPLRVETVIPMRRHRVIVNEPDRGFEADLTFEAGTGAHEEARQIYNDGVQKSLDITRLSQFGSWSGWIRIKGKYIEVDPRVTNGTRDRSWGIRPCGEKSARPNMWSSQIYFVWSQTFWDNFVLHGMFFADQEGALTTHSGAVIPRVPKGDEPVFARDTGEIQATPCEYEMNYIPGTRRVKDARIQYKKDNGEIMVVEYEPIISFQMAGLGYFHPEWAHGCWKGGYAIDDETWKCDELDITQPHLFHVQQVCKVTLNGKQTSCGILENIPYGPHKPSGFKGLDDLYQGKP
ncbi:MAG: hypothetical protein COA75_09270 [Cellvibrionales bacterium]|nr:MAG: hypothetical protein COA75_09270 [Cellvibrionales bacterium]